MATKWNKQLQADISCKITGQAALLRQGVYSLVLGQHWYIQGILNPFSDVGVHIRIRISLYNVPSMDHLNLRLVVGYVIQMMIWFVLWRFHFLATFVPDMSSSCVENKNLSLWNHDLFLSVEFQLHQNLMFSKYATTSQHIEEHFDVVCSISELLVNNNLIYVSQVHKLKRHTLIWANAKSGE